MKQRSKFEKLPEKKFTNIKELDEKISNQLQFATRIQVETALRDRSEQRTLGVTSTGQVNWHIKCNSTDEAFIKNPAKVVYGDLRKFHNKQEELKDDHQDKKGLNDYFWKKFTQYKRYKDTGSKIDKEPEMLLEELIFEYQKRGDKIPKLTQDHNMFKVCGLNMENIEMDKYVKRVGVPNCFLKDEEYVENIEKFIQEKQQKDEERRKFKYTQKSSGLNFEEEFPIPVDDIKIPKISDRDLLKKIRVNKDENKQLTVTIGRNIDYEKKLEDMYNRSLFDGERDLTTKKSARSILADKSSNMSGRLTRTSSMNDNKMNSFLKSSKKKNTEIKFPNVIIQETKKDDEKEIILNDDARTTRDSGFFKPGQKTGENFNTIARDNPINSTADNMNRSRSQFTKTKVTFFDSANLASNDNGKVDEEIPIKISKLKSSRSTINLTKKISENLENKKQMALNIEEINKKANNQNRFNLKTSSPKSKICFPKSPSSPPTTQKLKKEKLTNKLRMSYFNRKDPVSELEKQRIEQERVAKLKQERFTFLTYIYEKLNAREYNEKLKKEIIDYFIEHWRVSDDQIDHAINKLQAADIMKNINEFKKHAAKFDIPETYRLYASTYGSTYGGFELKNSLLREVSDINTSLNKLDYDFVKTLNKLIK